MGTFTNSEDSDEMLHNVAFHQGLHCSLNLKKIFWQKVQILTWHPYIYIYNELSQVYYINKKEESISVQRVKSCIWWHLQNFCFFREQNRAWYFINFILQLHLICAANIFKICEFVKWTISNGQYELGLFCLVWCFTSQSTVWSCRDGQFT